VLQCVEVCVALCSPSGQAPTCALQCYNVALQCVAVNCSVVQCVPVRYSVSQCAAGSCSALQHVAVCLPAGQAPTFALQSYCVVFQCVAAVCCRVLPCVCCSLLQCVAVCCSVVQRVKICCSELQCHNLSPTPPCPFHLSLSRACAPDPSHPYSPPPSPPPLSLSLSFLLSHVLTTHTLTYSPHNLTYARLSLSLTHSHCVHTYSQHTHTLTTHNTHTHSLADITTTSALGVHKFLHFTPLYWLCCLSFFLPLKTHLHHTLTTLTPQTCTC